MNYRKKQTGFTIVELLIVIVVIAILAAISIVAYNGIQNRARASAVVTDIKALEKGLRLLAIDEGRSTWWIDNELVVGTSNPRISNLVTDTNLKNYFQGFSEATKAAINYGIYDHDLNSVYSGCSATDNGGVNIYIYNVSDSLATAVDNNLDDGDLACGGVTKSGSTMRYSISRDASL